MATCLAETILETAASSGFTKLSEEDKLYVMLQSVYEASGSSDDLDTLMENANTAGFSKIASDRYKFCILLQLLVSKNAGTTTATNILSDAAQSQFMFLAENDKKSAALQLLCDINAFDPDAAAFFSRAGITDDTEKAAIDALVIELKDTAPLWNGALALYPIVGGTQEKFRYNLVDATFPITWVNTMDVTALGVGSDGSSYGLTGITRADMTSKFSMFCYKTEAANSGDSFPQVISSYNGATSPRELGHNSPTVGANRVSATAAQTPAFAGDNSGLYGLTCDATVFYSYTRATERDGPTLAGNLAGDPTSNHALLTRYTTTVSGNLWYTNAIGFFGFWNSDIRAYVTQLNTAMENFQTALGRNA